jgi:hypothetical protein
MCGSSIEVDMETDLPKNSAVQGIRLVEQSDEYFCTSCRSIPMRKGRRPTTISGPLHIQCDEYGDPQLLLELVAKAITWPGVEVDPSAFAGADYISMRLSVETATDNSSAFISKRDFAGMVSAAPTIYLRLPLYCAHWAILNGWAEPHFSSTNGLMPPGVMIVYAPRDERELLICEWLLKISYTFSLGKKE